MSTKVRRFLLQLWRRVPRRARRWVIRLFAPSFTVGAVCVIERQDGAVLLVQQVYRKGWGLPGGLLNRREDISVCARREVREEVGLEIDLVGEPAVVVDARPQRVDVVFRARPRGGASPGPVEPRSVEITEARWFRPEALPELQPEAVSALVALARSNVVPAAWPQALGPLDLASATRATGSG